MNYFQLQLEELTDLSKNAEELEKAISSTYGQILYDMKDVNVFPSVKLLLDSKCSYVIPFLSQHYKLTEAENIKFRKMCSPEIEDWALSVVYHGGKGKDCIIPESNLKGDLSVFIDESIEGVDVDNINSDPISPMNAAELLKMGKVFFLHDSYDSQFLKETLKFLIHEEKIKSFKFFEEFVSVCISADVRHKRFPSFSFDDFRYLERNCFGYSSLSSFEGRSPENKIYMNSREFALNRIYSWQKYKSNFQNAPSKEILLLGVHSKEVQEAFKESVSNLNWENFSFNKMASFKKYDLPGSEPQVENFLISEIGEDAARALFKNLLPELWTVDDLNSPEIDNFVKNNLVTSDGSLNQFMIGLFTNNKKDYFFNPSFIDNVAKKLNWSSLSYGFEMKNLSENASYNFLNFLIHVIEHTINNNYYFHGNRLSTQYVPIEKLFDFRQFMSEKNDKTGKFFALLDRLGNNDALWKYDMTPNAFGDLRNFNQLSDFFNQHFLMKPTVDKALIVNNMSSSENNTIKKNLLKEIVSKLNPIDVEILKELISDDILKDIKGDKNAPIGTVDNCCYRRANFFNHNNYDISNTLFSNGFKHQVNLQKVIMESPVQVITLDFAFKYLKASSTKNNKKEFGEFLINYSKSFPDFIALNDSNMKVINSIPVLSKHFSNNNVSFSYEEMMALNSDIATLNEEKNYTKASDLKTYFMSFPHNLKENLINKFIENQDWKITDLNVLDDSIAGKEMLNNLINKLFLDYPNDFKESKYFSKSVIDSEFSFLNMIKTAKSRDLVESQISFLFELADNKPHYYHHIGDLGDISKENLTENTKKVIKSMLFTDDFCHLIHYAQIQRMIPFSVDEISEILTLVPKNLTLEKTEKLLLNRNALFEDKALKFPGGKEDFFLLLNSALNLPDLNKFLFVLIYSNMVFKKQELHSVLKENSCNVFLKPKDKDILPSETDVPTFALMSFFPEIYNVQKLKDNEVLLDTYKELIAFLRKENNGSFVIDAINKATSGGIKFLKKNGQGDIDIHEVETFIDAIYMNNRAIAKESFKDGLYQGLLKMNELNLHKLSEVFEISNDNIAELFDVLPRFTEIDTENKKSMKGKSDASKIDKFTDLATQIQNLLKRNMLSDENIKKIAFAVNGAMLNAKLKNGIMSSAEYAVFLNNDLISTVDVVSKKKNMENIFNIHPIEISDGVEEDLSFKI